MRRASEKGVFDLLTEFNEDAEIDLDNMVDHLKYYKNDEVCIVYGYNICLKKFFSSESFLLLTQTI
jgi:hypothetical protein